MNTVPSTIALFTESGTHVKTFDIILDPSISYSDLKSTVELSANVHLIKILFRDEEGDMITVTTENELQEAYRFSSSQNSLFIKAICKSNTKKEKPLKLNDPIVVIAPVKSEAEDGVITVIPAPATIGSQTCINPTVIKTEVRSTCRKPRTEPPISFVTSPPQPVVVKNQTKSRHMAFCDFCKKDIFGIRYKCSSCPNYDLCEICEEKNLADQFHPQNHYFLKINKPVRTAVLDACVRTPITHSTASTEGPQLKDRVVAAESRLQSLEQKFKEISSKPKSLRALRKLVMLEEQQAKSQAAPASGSSGERKKRLARIITPSTPPASSQTSENITTDCGTLHDVDNTDINSLARAVVGLSIGEESPSSPVQLESEPTQDIQSPQAQPEEPQVLTPSSVPEPSEKAEKVVDSPLVSQLLLMGFERAQVLNVVEVCPDIESALEQLLMIDN
jgi:hypothetical protein